MIRGGGGGGLSPGDFFLGGGGLSPGDSCGGVFIPR